MFKTFETELAGRKLSIETGKIAELANGSVMVRYGDTVVMVNVTASKEPRDGIDFFPLSVDYEEKLYSVGKIPGSYQKREGKPADKAILTSRAIDRPLRPLFPKDFRNDVCVVATVLSVEPDNLPEVAAMIGASAALSISDIPFGGPTAAVNVGYVNDQIVINPTLEQRENSRLTLTVAGTKEKIAMIEAGADEIPDDTMLEAIKQAHIEIKKLCDFIQGMKDEIGKPKFEYKSFEVDHDVYAEIEEKYAERMYKDVQAVDKEVRDAAMDKLLEDVKAYFIEKYGEEVAEEKATDIADSLYKLEKKSVRKMILEEKKRPDGRKIDEIRPLSCEVGLLPRVHGSALFTRGQTQVMSVVTLGMASEEQELDGIDEESSKRYMHQYNFPSYSVGEARPSRGPGRREIGHGALAEKALVPVIPSEDEFPYAIRVVSEVLSSNGSTSQASICGSTLALMDAGVPIKRPVAGISTGLVTDENDPNHYIMLTDIQGLEDFFGDMDFKVTGTHDGITAIQMDIKIHGLTRPIVEEAIARTREARLYIMDEVMSKAIAEPRKEVAPLAPKIIQIQIDPMKIGDVVGQRGKTINEIIERTGVKIDINDEGAVSICGTDKQMMQKAVEMIEIITTNFEEGQIFKGKVISIKEFGAFIEFAPGKEGMVHISKITKGRINHVEDVLTLGDMVTVVCLGKDKMGRVSFSMKDVPKDN